MSFKVSYYKNIKHREKKKKLDTGMVKDKCNIGHMPCMCFRNLYTMP